MGDLLARQGESDAWDRRDFGVRLGKGAGIAIFKSPRVTFKGNYGLGVGMRNVRPLRVLQPEEGTLWVGISGVSGQIGDVGSMLEGV